MTTIKQLSKQIHSIAVEKGFWDERLNVGEKLMLIVSELSEALEADRKNHYAEGVDIGWMDSSTDESHLLQEHFPEKIKDTFQDELADTAIRLFDLAYTMDIDLEWFIKAKMRFNATRPKMHNKKY